MEFDLHVGLGICVKLVSWQAVFMCPVALHKLGLAPERQRNQICGKKMIIIGGIRYSSKKKLGTIFKLERIQI